MIITYLSELWSRIDDSHAMAIGLKSKACS
jgi:hypothetical protein